MPACCSPATTAKPGEPYDDLDEVYGRMLGQWALEMNHVAAIVGGFSSQQKHAGQTGVRFTPIPRDKQTHAVGFLNANAFEVPSWVGPGNRTAADAALDFDVSVDPVSCWVDYAIRGKG